MMRSAFRFRFTIRRHRVARRSIALTLLALLFAAPALAQKQGGVLRVAHRDSPGNMSIHENGTISVVMPMMGVFNNLVLYDQHVPQNSLDGWAMAELDNLIVEATREYDAYQFHRVFRLLHDFCAVQISAMYGNAMKDRLYCEAANSPLRRRAQTVMYRMLVALTKLVAPMLVFTADEAWEYIQHKPDEDKDLPSVHLAMLPKPSGQTVSEEQREEWKLLMDLRDQALSQIDKLTRQIGKYKALDAEVIYHVDDDVLRRKLQVYGADLEDLVGAGYWSFAEKGTEGPAVTVEVVDRREMYKTCARSWKRRPDVGQDPQFPDLTLRDAVAVRARKS